MKKVSTAFAIPFFFGLLLARIPAISAQTGTITQSFGDVVFRVHRYDDGAEPTFEVTFDHGFASTYEIDLNGFVTVIYADNEKYRMRYRPNGKLRKLTSIFSRRQLETGSDAADMVHTYQTFPTAMVDAVEMAPTPDVRRRLLECDECLQMWDVVCGNGLDTVCALDGYGSPIQSAGEASISVFCKDFGSICHALTANEVCKAECVVEPPACLPPLTITLEYEVLNVLAYSTGESDAGFLYLFVIEPGGQTSYWANRDTSTGDQVWRMNESITYTMKSGLGADGPTGRFVAFMEWDSYTRDVSWTLTAVAGNGDVLINRQGQFAREDCGSTTLMRMYGDLDEYVDNGC